MPASDLAPPTGYPQPADDTHPSVPVPNQEMLGNPTTALPKFNPSFPTSCLMCETITVSLLFLILTFIPPLGFCLFIPSDSFSPALSLLVGV